MDQIHFFCKAGERQRIFRRGVPAANDRYRFTTVGHTVTGRAVVYASACPFSLTRYPKRSWRRTGRNYNRSRHDDSFAGLQPLDRLLQFHRFHLCQNCLSTKAFRTALHLLSECKAINPCIKAGIVVDLLRQSHLPAGGELLQHHNVQSGSRRIECRCVASRPAADHSHVIDLHAHPPSDS